MRTLLCRVVMTFALLALAACDVQNEAPPPVLHDRDVSLTLLHTADWHSRIFPYQMTVLATDANLGLQQSHAPFGGAARINWLIQRERAQADRVLHLDSGDCFQGAPVFNFFSGEAEVRALDATGVDGAVVGNHEFDRGALNFAIQYQRWATFPVLAANYQFEDPTMPGSAALATFVRPYHIYNVRGLKVGVIGFGNLSSVTSLFDQPNRLGVTALNTQQVAQFYVDMMRDQHVDLVVGVSHLGLSDDQEMIATTNGFDVVLGGHLHIVLNPPNVISDCQPFDEQGQHFIPEVDPAGTQMQGDAGNNNAATNCDPYHECCSPFGVCRPDPLRYHGYHGWQLVRGYRARYCHPRDVVLQHSGAFVKYLGRLDLVLSDNPHEMVQSDGGGGRQYDPYDRFEVISHRYTLFPVDSTVPEEPTVARLLEPYSVALGQVANLDNLVGYAPAEISRTNQSGGDSPMGNLVCTAMWRRLGIQTDFSMTNTLGIRDNIPPGPVTIDQIYNVFPFDNQITTMLLSGHEVLDMFDFIARRSSGRGCNSQAQIAGARTYISCGTCDRDGVPGTDTYIDNNGQQVAQPACAQTVNVGLLPAWLDESGTPTTIDHDTHGNPRPAIPGVPTSCTTDADCLTCGYSDEAPCSGTCRHVQTDPANCGGCGHFCTPAQVCANGACMDTCPAGTNCNGSCVDTQSDHDNCGVCGHACGVGTPCVNGACGYPCSSGSLNNCCPTGQTNSGGKCCPTGQINCGGVCRMGSSCLDAPQLRSLCNPAPPASTFMQTPASVPCSTNADCSGYHDITVCDPMQMRCVAPPPTGRCMLPIAGEAVNGSYALATNDYVANGGSGFFVLQRNTTQVNTGVQLRDAVSDNVQLGNPCGFNRSVADAYRMHNHIDGHAFQPDDGLEQCSVDTDCHQDGFVCACQDRFQFDSTSQMCGWPQGVTNCGGAGRCVLQQCRDDMATQLAQRCPTVPPADGSDPTAVARCNCSVMSRASQTCRILACFDEQSGAFADGRIHMVTQ